MLSQQDLLEYIQKNRAVLYGDISKNFNVTHRTVRRHICKLGDSVYVWDKKIGNKTMKLIALTSTPSLTMTTSTFIMTPNIETCLLRMVEFLDKTNGGEIKLVDNFEEALGKDIAEGKTSEIIIDEQKPTKTPELPIQKDKETFILESIPFDRDVHYKSVLSSYLDEFRDDDFTTFYNTMEYLSARGFIQSDTPDHFTRVPQRK